MKSKRRYAYREYDPENNIIISHKIRQGFKGDVGDVNATVANHEFNSCVDTRAVM